ncbi:citrate synthase/methylcitrate synthase [Bacillus suaedaesalsae]|uniref:Citrate synthase n=1 Tax=Bacillus suaedaesalsae TaxID=2810349 RepID=A0ABS2DDL0_9BACI|nr:citrate synthase/methylcitrate synthase [Bacillus suaedaesalsae]MBM6616537.1 citrate synthase/methylcitrate synthase [Bacillus suaedaesalsae]
MIQPGLKGVIATETSISHIDGEKGLLIYRGYEVNELTEHFSFEEVAYLLWYGELPSETELTSFKEELKKQRNLSSYLKKIVDYLPKDIDMMSVLRTVISAEGTLQYGWKPTITQSIKLTSMIPTVIAYRKHSVDQTAFIEPRLDLGHVENYLYMLNGELPTTAQTNALETYMILTMEHGMNASTFSARVTASTESDMISAVTSAIGTMKGPLHGGAPSEVIHFLDEVSCTSNVEKIIRKKLSNGEKLMGFGHRVYKTHDPRAVSLKNTLLKQVGEDEWLDLALHVEITAIKLLEEFKPGRALYTNVEFYSAAIMKAINMDPCLFTPTFTASRLVGWTAHVLEQAQNNTIYRPQSKYVGKLVKLNKR